MNERFCHITCWPRALSSRSHLPSACHRHPVGGEQVVVDQVAADRRVRVAVLAVVVDAHGRAVGEMDAARALDVHEEHFHRVFEVQQLQPLAGQRPLLDLGARRKGRFAGRRLAHVRQPVGLGGAVRLVDDVHEIGRPLVDRRLELAFRRARAFQHRLVVAGQQPLAASAARRDAARTASRRTPWPRPCWRPSASCAARQATASSPAGTLHWRDRLVRRRLGRRLADGIARLEECLERSEMVVARPAGQIGERHALELGLGLLRHRRLGGRCGGLASVDVGGVSLLMLGEAAGCGEGFSGGAAAAPVATSMAATAPAVAVRLAAARARAPAMVACDVPSCRQPRARGLTISGSAPASAVIA